MIEQLQVGKITSTHGLKGEVKVFPTTDDPRRFEELERVILEQGRRSLTLEIEGVRYFKQFVILKFKGLDDINDVEGFKGAALLRNREDLGPLEEDEYYMADLMGLEVTSDEGESLGKLVDIMETGANDVYVVQDEAGHELLIPAVKQFIVSVDPTGGTMVVHLIPGMR